MIRSPTLLLVCDSYNRESVPVSGIQVSPIERNVLDGLRCSDDDGGEHGHHSQ
jgi:hypothetical protein